MNIIQVIPQLTKSSASQCYYLNIAHVYQQFTTNQYSMIENHVIPLIPVIRPINPNIVQLIPPFPNMDSHHIAYSRPQIQSNVALFIH